VKLFQRRRTSGTGHPVDIAQLARLRARTDLSLPRHWMHYLYVADEPAARAAAAEVISDGWDLDRVEPVPGSAGWVVIAEQHDAVLSADRVAAARRFFEGLADRSSGGEYGGWKSQP